ncbi:MAG TPA: hypothetical protein VGE15_00365 [Sphingobacteriaceae bacterium]
MEEFKITRVFSDESGESRFEELQVPLTEAGPIGYLSERYEVESLIFRTVLSTYDYDFHTAPARQFIILLDGAIEIETSLGDKKSFQAGDVLLVEDVAGQGHKTRNLEPAERRSVFVTLKGPQ